MNDLTQWLEGLHEQFQSDPQFRPQRISGSEGPFKGGFLTCTYDWDEDGSAYVLIGFELPKDVFAEIDDKTYGTLYGFRIYTDPAETYMNHAYVDLTRNIPPKR